MREGGEEEGDCVQRREVLPEAPGGERGEHELAHRVRVSPVVVRHLAVVLLRRDQPLHQQLMKTNTVFKQATSLLSIILVCLSFEKKTLYFLLRGGGGARQFVHARFRTHISYKNQNKTFRTKAKPDISYKNETRHFVQKRNQTFRTKTKPDISYKNETRHFVQFILYNLLL